MEAGLFTYADRRAGLPVVSVIHLYTGDFVVPLELVSWVTLKGHWIPRLTAISTTTAIHWYTWVPAGCGYWAWTERDREEEREHRERSGGERGESNSKNLCHTGYLCLTLTNSSNRLLSCIMKYLLRSFLTGQVRFSSTTIMQIWILSYVKCGYSDF